MPEYERRTIPPSEPQTNREIINKIENDITLLRGEVMRLSELIKGLHQTKKTASTGWLFSQ